MIYHFILFPLFLLAIISLGAFFSYLLAEVMHLHEGIIDDLSIQGIVGLFFLGMVGVVFNFFLPLASQVFLGMIGTCIVAGGIILIKEKVRFLASDIFVFVLISVILAPLAGVLAPGYDGGLYHLPQQLWLRNESIVVGLANLHGRFGFGSLYEYISAPLWIKEQFTMLSYLQVSFLVYFLFFLIKQVRISRGTHLILLLGVTVNLALFSGYLNLVYTLTDIPSGLIFSSAFIYGHWLLFREEVVQRGEWTVFAILLLSAVFYKLSAAILIFWMIFVLLYRISSAKDSVRECILGLAIPICILLIFLIKNFITTGCVLYPEVASCLDVSWAATKNAINDANWVTAWARHPRSGLYSLQDTSWFLNWWFPNNQVFLVKLLKAGLSVGVLYAGVALITRFRSFKILDIRLWAAVVFALLSFSFWFLKAPTPRFGIGAFILLFPVLFLFLHASVFEETEKLRKFLQMIAVFAVMIFVCRIGEPWKRVSFENALTFNALTVPKKEVKKDPVYGVRPKKGDQCWTVPECAPYGRPPKSSWHGRTTFYSN